ncbi:MAG: hypothetical protein MK096_14520 [Oleiphilaceae bacterium]|uniref:hypothetical protein n=1 Tax=Oleiphilus sp. HI0125 TaxID=1822266 RepID=UPI0007C40673|nr:hypothetical protein [Oleiphilus sp. HI0125]KZZ63390.1 hypothetical protein A3762_12400 [Oleiphilus sp. HI0125]MCH2159979.1 hypothetical protein [Oleiphilaceae bacterium]
MLRVAVSVVIAFMVSACGGGSSGESSNIVNSETLQGAPVIGRILTDVRSFSKSYGGTRHVGEVETVTFSVNAEVTDPQGFDDIDTIYLHKNDELDWRWDIYNGGYRSYCEIENTHVFECYFYDANSLHRIDLSDWELVVEDNSGNISAKRFDFNLPGGNEPNFERFIYSEYYTGPTELGVPTMPSLRECHDAFVFSRESTQSYEFRFTVNDHRVKEYAIELWGFDGVWSYIGYVPINSPSISSKPVIHGIETRVFIPFSEMIINEGYTSSDVDAFHIVLFDDFIEISPNYFWNNHLSVSEMLMPDGYLDRDIYPGLSCN